ncbi:PKD domain-containing protein, partial [Robiginitomaculum antarcticum]|uniref:PKD domain-containing protein n=1 Tax=Robiginitomaculum antarcticum TaxID=437507 RepID=UPI001F2BE2EF
MYDLSVASVGSAMSLFFNVTERDNHTGGASDGDVVSSTEITPAILRAAGGECEAIANSIDPVNTAPTADAGPDQNITSDAGLIVTLNGAASSDPQGDTLNYTWTQTGGTTVTLSDANIAMPTFPTPNADTTLVFSLIVNDGSLDSAPSTTTVNFTFVAGNSAPTADAGADQTITAAGGATITLDGSASSDLDGDPLTYMWTQTSGTAVALSDATAVMPTFSAPNADATLVFSLVVNDGTVDSAPATATVTYTFSATNTAPEANAGPNQDITAAAGTTITLDGSGSTDIDGDTLTYMWVQAGTPSVTLTGADTVSPTFPAPAADETLFFDLIVNDGTVDSVADRVRIAFTAVATNTAPVADAGADQAITAVAGTSITLDGSASMDADSDPLTYMWTQTSGTAVTLSDATAVSPTFAAPGADATLV